MMPDHAQSSATSIKRSIALAQKMLRNYHSRRMLWQSLLGIVIFADIFAILRLIADLPWQWVAVAAIFPFLWLVRHWLISVPATTAAHFLDDRHHLAQSVISSYRLLENPGAGSFRDLLLEETARRLSRVGAPYLEPTLSRSMGRSLIILGLSAAFLCFLPQMGSARHDSEIAPVPPNLRSAAAFAVKDIARKLQQSGERKLATQFAHIGDQWHREKTATEDILRHIEKLERITAEERDALHRRFSHAQGSEAGVAGLPFLPLPIRKALSEAISRLSQEYSFKEGLPLAQAVKEGQKNEATRSAQALQKEIARRTLALRQSLLALRQLSQGFGEATGIESGHRPGRSTLMTSGGASFYGDPAPGTRSERAPQVFLGPHRKESATSYLTNPSWPAKYHAVVQDYFAGEK